VSRAGPLLATLQQLQQQMQAHASSGRYSSDDDFHLFDKKLTFRKVMFYPIGIYFDENILFILN
jgi:hypothetical protein